MKSKILTLILLIISLAVFSSKEVMADEKAQVKPKKRIAVLNFSANNTSNSTARIVRNSIELNLFKSKKFNILEKDQVKHILKERKLQLSECNDEDCAVEIGKILNTQFIIIGSVDKLDKFTIHIKVVDVNKKQVLIADSIETDEIGKIRKISVTISEKIADKIEDIGRKRKPIVLSTDFHFITPLGYLKDRVNYGFGFTVTARMEDIFFKHFILGIDIQFMYFTGKSGVSHHAILVPITFSVGYRIKIKWFSIVPLVSGGGSYNMIYYYTGSGSSDYSGNSAFQPIIKAGLNFEFRLHPSISLQVKSKYGAIFEKDGTVQFLAFGAGVGFLF